MHSSSLPSPWVRALLGVVAFEAVLSGGCLRPPPEDPADAGPAQSQLPLEGEEARSNFRELPTRDPIEYLVVTNELVAAATRTRLWISTGGAYQEYPLAPVVGGSAPVIVAMGASHYRPYVLLRTESKQVLARPWTGGVLAVLDDIPLDTGAVTANLFGTGVVFATSGRVLYPRSPSSDEYLSAPAPGWQDPSWLGATPNPTILARAASGAVARFSGDPSTADGTSAWVAQTLEIAGTDGLTVQCGGPSVTPGAGGELHPAAYAGLPSQPPSLYWTPQGTVTVASLGLELGGPCVRNAGNTNVFVFQDSALRVEEDGRVTRVQLAGLQVTAAFDNGTWTPPSEPQLYLGVTSQGKVGVTRVRFPRS